MLVAVEPSFNRTVTVGVETPSGVDIHEFVPAKLEEAIEFITSLDNPTILGHLGGPGQFLLIRLRQQENLETHRIPFHSLNSAMNDAAVNSDAEARVGMLIQCFKQAPGLFYEMNQLDLDIFSAREFSRARLAVQDHRKRAQLQYLAAERDLKLAFGLSYESSQAREIFSNPAMISGAKQDEKSLEAQIIKALKRVEIYQLLRSHDPLPSVKGIGPALGGGIIGEILDIRRFQTPQQLRAYARYTQGKTGGIPRRKKGEVANWSDKLHRPVWLWSTDQVPRYQHIWREVYEAFKLDELIQHPEIEIVERIDAQQRAYKSRIYTLGHLNKRAQRRTASLFLEYLHGLWTALATGIDPIDWYTASPWPVKFTTIQSDLARGGRAQLASLIAARKGSVDDVEDDGSDE